MSEFYFREITDYEEAVTEALESIGEMDRSDAQGLVDVNEEKITYGFKTRIAADVLVASILGISNCIACDQNEIFNKEIEPECAGAGNKNRMQ